MRHDTYEGPAIDWSLLTDAELDALTEIILRATDRVNQTYKGKGWSPVGAYAPERQLAQDLHELSWNLVNEHFTRIEGA